ncbi:(2Fe-2S)-binding protein [Corynebacterium sp.]|uniref:(2Fe-2S)-binding protein n=1 Tax=Corynebacterium sp. TaxID=1720 RepID=UPI0026DC8051|nr:(2Fe-2S)-binding protein [Corynebacterium sp.]MDO5076523.1 (2Fe-2S)-binding protein [Corynebacterium sp.]
MHSVFAQVLAEYPRFRTAVTPEPGAVAVTVSELATPERLAAAIAACERLFALGDARWAGQLWWFSFNNSMVAPAVTAMVDCYRVPSLDLSAGALHVQPGDYWYSFSTDIVAADGAWREAGAEYAASITPLIDALTTAAGVKPAPLWAVAADALVGAAVAAGNEAFDPYRGVHIACELSEGFAAGASAAASSGAKAPTIPKPRFEDVRDGVMVPTDVAAARAGEEPDGEVHTVARRASCCMIYRSPVAEMCVSCPKQDPAERRAGTIAYVQ